jgi:hypothetical protein
VGEDLPAMDVWVDRHEHEDDGNGNGNTGLTQGPPGSHSGFYWRSTVVRNLAAAAAAAGGGAAAEGADSSGDGSKANTGASGSTPSTSEEWLLPPAPQEGIGTILALAPFGDIDDHRHQGGVEGEGRREEGGRKGQVDRRTSGLYVQWGRLVFSVPTRNRSASPDTVPVLPAATRRQRSRRQSVRVASGPMLDDMRWHHVALTYHPVHRDHREATATSEATEAHVVLYVDGTRRANGTVPILTGRTGIASGSIASGSIASGSINNADNVNNADNADSSLVSVRVGAALGCVVGAGPLRGLVDEVLIYKHRSLAQEDIRTAMVNTRHALPIPPRRDVFDASDEFCPRPESLLQPCCLLESPSSGEPSEVASEVASASCTLGSSGGNETCVRETTFSTSAVTCGS